MITPDNTDDDLAPFWLLPGLRNIVLTKDLKAVTAAAKTAAPYVLRGEVLRVDVVNHIYRYAGNCGMVDAHGEDTILKTIGAELPEAPPPEPKKETELERQIKATAAQQRWAAMQRQLPRSLLGGDNIYPGSDDYLIHGFQSPELEIADLTDAAASLTAKDRDALDVASKPKPLARLPKDDPFGLSPKPKPTKSQTKASQPKISGIEIVDHYQTKRHPSGLAPSLENTLRAILEFGIVPRHNVFHNKILFNEHADLLDGEFENACLVIKHRIAHQRGFEPSKDIVIEAVTRIAMANRFNPIIDYFDSLRWDNHERLDRWLTTYCGAADNKLNQAIGRKFFIALVRRVNQPGCKFDSIMVLESPQGFLKSTFARALAGDGNFADAEILQSNKREQQELCEGVWVYEIPELSGLHKSDVERVKAFASRQEDKARPAYARTVQSRPRTCVFLGTTNDREYLMDSTGNRRFWSVPIDKIDIDAFQRDRDQLFAEAIAAESSGEPLFLPEALWPDAQVRQHSRMIPDPWIDLLAMFRDNDATANYAPEFKASFGTENPHFALRTNESNLSYWRVSSEFILTSILKIPPDRQTNAQAKKLATTMRNFGWQTKDFKFGSKTGKGYWKLNQEAT